MPRALLLLLAVSLAAPVGSIAHAGRGKAAAPARGIVKRTGDAIGFAAGFAVTAGLVVSKKWNAPLQGADGKPVTVRERGHEYTLKQRHKPVLGPKITARAERMPASTPVRRTLQQFVSGVGEGATRAPPAEGRAEARLSAALKELHGAR